MLSVRSKYLLCLIDIQVAHCCSRVMAPPIGHSSSSVCTAWCQLSVRYTYIDTKRKEEKKMIPHSMFVDLFEWPRACYSRYASIMWVRTRKYLTYHRYHRTTRSNDEGGTSEIRCKHPIIRLTLPENLSIFKPNTSWQARRRRKCRSCWRLRVGKESL